jgi:UDP-galactopyranose mutase
MTQYDYIIVGSGFFGSIFAYELKKRGFSVLVLEKRNHIGGNCYTNKKDDINIHEYGPHIFHTSNEEVWGWINQFTEFNNFTLRPVANFKGEIFSLPFNMWTFNKLWGVVTPEEAKLKIKEQSNGVNNPPSNLEEQAIKLVGSDVYEKLIKGYTEKQWKKECKHLPPEIIKRLPVRFTYDNNYFNDKYQGIPKGGYTPIFEKLLDGIEVRLGVDYLENKKKWDSLGKKIVYTGPIDRYFNYQYGELEYKTTLFKHKKINSKNYQGCVMVNYTDIETKFTRVIEHKHFENDIDSDCSWVTWEYPNDYNPNINEPYYPVNDEKNNKIYESYYRLTKNETNVIFGGRLAEYKYYDMDKVILSALNKIKKELKEI